MTGEPLAPAFPPDPLPSKQRLSPQGDVSHVARIGGPLALDVHTYSVDRGRSSEL
jgi:hypothetical protein